MAVVQAQPVFGSPYEPGREAMRAVEFGQGLRARQDALQRQTAEYNREQQVRELLGSGKPEEAKKLMTLQERSQLVNMQGALLNQKVASIELDLKEKAVNDTYRFIDEASKLDPSDPAFERRTAGLASRAAPVVSANPQYAAVLNATLNAKIEENKLTKKEEADKALELFHNITAASATNGWTEEETINGLNEWQSQNTKAFQGPYGRDLVAAKNNFMRELNTRSLINKRAGGVNVDTTMFKAGQRVMDPTLGREVIWSNTITSIRDVETGLPLYIRIPDPNNQYEVINVRNPDLPWPEIEAQPTGTNGTPVPDNLFDDTTFDRISS